MARPRKKTPEQERKRINNKNKTLAILRLRTVIANTSKNKLNYTFFTRQISKLNEAKKLFQTDKDFRQYAEDRDVTENVIDDLLVFLSSERKKVFGTGIKKKRRKRYSPSFYWFNGEYVPSHVDKEMTWSYFFHLPSRTRTELCELFPHIQDWTGITENEVREMLVLLSQRLG